MKKVLLSIMAVALLSMPAVAYDMENSQIELEIQSLRSGGTEYVNAFTGDDKVDDDFSFGFDQEEDIYEYDFKSPRKAFVYSLIVPGWGQRYTKSSVLKSLLFLGIEAGMWMGYFDYHNEGGKLEDEFQDYANTYWDEDTYRTWLADNNLDEEDLTHQLPDSKSQQYYEMIGKYDQFRAGWEEYWNDPDYYEQEDSLGNLINITADRDDYEDQRRDANDKLDQANNFIIYAMLNHLLSAFDSALAAKRHNKKESEAMWLSVNTEMKKYSATESIPIIRLSYRF